MFSYFKDLWKKFKDSSVFKKCLTIFFVIIYIGIVLINVIPVSVDANYPGQLNLVGNVIKIEEQKQNYANIYTVSVTTYEKVSFAQYLLSKANKKIDIERHDYDEDDFTPSEYHQMDACLKAQSIQDSLIVAYNQAKEEGYDVSLDYQFKGVVVTLVPISAYNLSDTSLQIGDCITKIGDTVIDSFDTFKTIVKDFKPEISSSGLVDGKVNYPMTVIRGDEEIVLNKCSQLCMYFYNLNYKEDQTSSLYYEFYDINYKNSKPSISLVPTNVVGPSGGAMQALYIYDTITGGSLLKDLMIAGTGTIDNKGNIGNIGGLIQKFYAAKYYSLDYFFYPEANSDHEYIEEHASETNAELHKLSTFKELVQFLKASKDGE